MADADARPTKALPWVALLYFAQGSPFALVTDLVPVFYKVQGVSLAALGSLSLLRLPYTFKVFWAPLVDRFGTRRRWIGLALVTMATLVAVYAGLPAAPTVVTWLVLGAFTVASATQDVAIDGYTVQLVPRGQEGVANGLRVAAFRVALITVGGGLVALAPWLGWRAVLFGAAGLLGLLALAVSFLPAGTSAPPSGGLGLAPLWRWLSQPGAVSVLAFILLYKLGDAAMGPMVKPFWLDRGLSVAEVGLVSTTLSIGATVVGALTGGWLTGRWGLGRALLWLGLAQAASNLAYAAAAATGWHAQAGIEITTLRELGRALTDPARGVIYGASFVESFTAGLGTAAFLSLLMRACDRAFAATQYALLSALFALSRDLAGAISGVLATELGYGAYFAATFAIALPAYALLPRVSRFIDQRPEASSDESAGTSAPG